MALAWLEAPDVASLGLDENEEPTFAETMAAIAEAYGADNLSTPHHDSRRIRPRPRTRLGHTCRSEEIPDPN